jgi:acyl-CoA reductase-like NAD-dependent aldehyde dehydrogenase
VGINAGHYRGYPRVVGETGGKDFVLARRSAHLDALAIACVRAAFECQGRPEVRSCVAPLRSAQPLAGAHGAPR